MCVTHHFSFFLIFIINAKIANKPTSNATPGAGNACGAIPAPPEAASIKGCSVSVVTAEVALGVAADVAGRTAATVLLIF